jgi:hypothetical protein
VNSARPPISAPRRTLVRLLPLPVVAAIAASVACRGADAPAATARAESPARPTRTGGLTPPGEVVIAAPSTRYLADSVTAAGSVTGVVTTTALQPGAPVSTGRDSATCGPSIPDESVSRQGNGLAGAVVWLDGLRRGKPLPLERRLELEADRCRLVPRVQAAVVGSAVNVIAHDAFRQHLHFLAGGEAEARARVLLGQDEQVIPTNLPFSKPGLVVVKDADHPWPTAYLAVFDHPYFAVTAPNGSFTIDGVPAGRYTVKVWHERAKLAEQTVDVSAGSTARVAVELKSK